MTSDPLVGEATTTLLALSKAKEADLSNFILAGDYSIVLEHLQAQGRRLSLPWWIATLISSLVDLLRTFSCVSLIKLPRESNFVAHNIIAWAAAYSFVGEVP